MEEAMRFMKGFIMMAFFMLLVSCSRGPENPFFAEWKTPFGTPPFDKIKEEHYLPAFEKALAEHDAEIQVIVNNQEPPTFENTILALEKSGRLLNKVSSVFYNLLSSNTNDQLQAIAKEMAPKMSRHEDDILLNEKLFQRIKAVYDQRKELKLTDEQKRLLDLYYKRFTRNGANLNPQDKERLRQINERLSVLTLQFGENVLKEVQRYEMILEKEDLAGLPQSVVEMAASEAKSRGYEGKYVFTIDKSSFIPFLQYSERRDLREKIFKAYIYQGDHNDSLDNKEIIREIVKLRAERAKLLGYPTHAHYVLEENMAKTPENVYTFLNEVWKPALQRAKAEAYELQQLIFKEGKNFKLMPWDWWYYAEKLRKEKYDLSDEELRPYFKLENVLDGLFMVVNRLYGLQFKERKDIVTYHPDVKVFEVTEKDGKHVGIIYLDYFPRKSKRGGAWMNAFRKQSKMFDKPYTPIICNVGNFTKPTPSQPSLLSLDEVETMFHEFGHALHGLLSDVTYESLSGTAVPRDYVEVFSQIMENWALQPEVLKEYARHYQTGEPIPDELIQKIKNSHLFNQGFATVEFMAAAYLDMDWHTLTTESVNAIQDVNDFEKASMNRIGLIPEIVVRYRSTYFRHIFSGGYSAGYYSYLWSEMIEADAFQAFEEKGIFDQETARSFRENMLSRGFSVDPMTQFMKFRGREPKIDALLKRRGLQ